PAASATLATPPFARTTSRKASSRPAGPSSWRQISRYLEAISRSLNWKSKVSLKSFRRILVLPPEPLGCFDVCLLGLLVSASDQDDDSLAGDGVVDAISLCVIDFEFH